LRTVGKKEPRSRGEQETEGREDSPTGAMTGTRLTAWQIYHNVRLAAEDDMSRPAMALFWSALAGGLTIGFSFAAAAYLAAHAPEGLKSTATMLGYPLGFVFVVLARNQLFTENTLEPVIPFLHSPSLATLGSLLRMWIIVLVGNLVGTGVFACLAAKTMAFQSPALEVSMKEVAMKAMEGGFGTVLYLAIFAGWLIALMAWLIASTRATGAQITIVWLSTAPISAFGFRHSVAGSVEAFYLAWADVISWPASVLGFVIPSVLGNIVGGFLLVALLNYGQTMAGRKAAQ
jgi:formate-nitrite transporter family protein